MTVEPALRRNTLVLVGLMGAGKTSVGRRLALALGLPFRDADEEVEKAAGRSVSDIFAELGEPAFRAGERRVIARLLDDGPHVLATGGGAFMNEETRALIKAKAISIWLRADVEVLVERVGRKQDRPLLKGKDAAATLRELAAVRHPVYALADLTVESIESPHSTTVNAIIAALRARAATDTTPP
jgi:shikimate kinase